MEWRRGGGRPLPAASLAKRSSTFHLHTLYLILLVVSLNLAASAFLIYVFRFQGISSMSLRVPKGLKCFSAFMAEWPIDLIFRSPVRSQHFENFKQICPQCKYRGRNRTGGESTRFRGIRFRNRGRNRIAPESNLGYRPLGHEGTGNASYQVIYFKQISFLRPLCPIPKSKRVLQIFSPFYRTEKQPKKIHCPFILRLKCNP